MQLISIIRTIIYPADIIYSRRLFKLSIFRVTAKEMQCRALGKPTWEIIL
jgi:hypothetical protein